MHELVNRLIRGLNDIDQTFMRLNHEILAAIPVDKRTSRNVKVCPVRRKRYRSHDPSARPDGGVQYLLTAVIYNPTVIRF